jgi:deazaflavin-dependent oxidoreductase (nitroreductase family)
MSLTAQEQAQRKRRRVTWFHRHLANPIMRRLAGYLPGQAVLETIGRRSGLPRRTPVGGRLDGASFWMVSDHGRKSHYVRNIEANPRVRIRIRGRWHTGSAHLLPGDDPRQRLRQLPRFNSALVRLLGTDLLTLRIDLDQPRR